MIDPILSLAVGVHGTRGAYALLVGSGVSRSAGVPTGWEITTDLITRIARLSGDPIGPAEAEDWHLERFGREADYSDLLDQLAKTSTERQQLLRAYFEPTEEEREEGLKRPTPAHRAIAALVKRGAVRVIITTNFDRLMELALEAEGIIPSVIASADAAAGALPLAHSACTVVKLHGDYMDTRIRNTTSELSSYPAEMDRLLDQILDEYGMITCGWSAEWDRALVAAFERAKNRRFTTYYTSLGQPTAAASRLLALRAGVALAIDGADGFFQSLSEKVTALEEMAAPAPLTTAAAVRVLKRYLPDPLHRIRLHDLVIEAADSLLAPLPPVATRDYGEYASSFRRIQTQSDLLMGVMAAIGFHGRPEHHALLTEALRRLATPLRQPFVSSDPFARLGGVSGLLAFYSAGMAAFAAAQFDTLERLFLEVKLRNPNRHREEPLVVVFDPTEVVERNAANFILGGKRHTPQSDLLNLVMRSTLQPYVGDESRYHYLFNQFEYLLYLVGGYEYQRLGDGWNGTVGRFCWVDHGTLRSKLAEDAEANKSAWLEAGLFDRDVERFAAVHAASREDLKRYPSH
jgi:hypothetical protein